MELHAYYKDVVEVYKTHSEKKANKYLSLGWVMLNVESEQSGRHDWHSVFVLGWFKTSGEVSHPKNDFN